MRASWREGWGARALRCGVLGFWAVGCSAADPGGSSTVATGYPTSSVVAPQTEVAAALPDSVPDLVRLAPKDAIAVLGLPSFIELATVLGKPTLDLGLEAIAGDLERVGVGAALASKTMTAFEGAVVSVEKEASFKPAITVIARLKDDSVIDPLVKAAKLEQKGPDRWQGKDIHVAWLAKAKVVLVSTSEKRLEKSLALAGADRGSFTESALYKPPAQSGIWLAVDPSFGGANGTFDAGSVVRLDIDINTGAMRLELIQNGARVPRIAEILAPTGLDAVGKLPNNPVGAFGFSIKRPAGKSLRDWVKEAERSTGENFDREVDDAVQKMLSLSLADIDRALGDELAFGAYYDGKGVPRKEELTENGAIFGTVAIRDEKVARRVVDAAGRLILGSAAKSKNGNLRLERGGVVLDVKTSNEKITFGFGSPALVGKLTASKKLLEGSKTFEIARKSVGSYVNGLAYLHFPRLLDLLPADSKPPRELTIDPVMFAYDLKRNDLGSHFVVESSEGLGAVATVAALTATSIFGVRRYLTASKTAEAKNTIGAIARGAVAGYERETGASTTHALCKSAQAVPTVVPSGTKYQPSADPGKDYETGTSLSGWRCLKFTITNPHYYQYDYRTGGNYKGPKRGLPDPGPNGFEASAEGDLDGDGKTSLFTLTGRVINGVVKLDTQLNVADELE